MLGILTIVGTVPVIEYWMERQSWSCVISFTKREMNRFPRAGLAYFNHVPQ